VEHVKTDQVSDRMELGKDAPGVDSRHPDAPQQDAPGRDRKNAPGKRAARQELRRKDEPGGDATGKTAPGRGADPQDAPSKQASPRLRRRFLRSNSILFLLAFVLPLAAFAAYLFFFASERYESLASATITEEKSTSQSIDLSMLGVTNSAADKDSLILKEFIESKDMMIFLDQRLRIREHVTKPSIDFYSRLSPDATIEEFHEYYQWLVTVEYDSLSKLIRFSVQGFDAEFPHAVLNLIVERSQQFIDRINDQITREQLRFFDLEIADSEARMKEAKEQLIAFQREFRLMTTEGESQTVMATIQTLEQELAQKQADLSARLQVLDRSAPQLQTVQMDITALESQIASAKERLAGSSDTSISELDSKFRDIQLNLEFVTNIYKSNLNALEQARLEAARRLKFLIVVAQPSAPEKAAYPRHAYLITTVAIVLLIIFFVVSLTMAIIREHS
jgi:capsular polysaccharide transport system permease protein